MRVFALLFIFAFVPALSLAVPNVGDQVIYTGKARLIEGEYDVRKTVTVLAYDLKTQKFSVRTTFEQTVDGQDMGTYDVDSVVALSHFQTLALGLIPALEADCGQDTGLARGTRRETLQTGVGELTTCRLESSPQKTELNITWWTPKTSPWAAQSLDKNLNDGSEMLMTIQSIRRSQKP